MARRPIITVANEPEEFICPSQKDLDRNAKVIADLPLIFTGRKLNRDQQNAVTDMISLKDPNDQSKGIAWGASTKYMWMNIILEVRNVYKPNDVIKGKEKDELWYTEGMSDEINIAVDHFYVKSLTKAEDLKTSDSVQDSTAG